MNRRGVWITGAALVASALPSARAGAQEGGEAERTRTRGPAAIEEIVVTAERREQALQDVPVSVSALSGLELDAAGVQEVEDLAIQVPNVHYGITERGEAIFTIRGVSTGGGDQNTAFHVDGVYQNSAAIPVSLSFFDTQRIEVLRGPQGTLYGRNATGGAVNVLSVPPSFELDAFGDVEVGTFDLRRTRAVLNVPILDDTLAVRASFLHEGRDGYQRNHATAIRNRDADDEGITGLRGQLRWLPRERMELIVRGSFVDEDEVGFAQKMLGPLPDLVSIPFQLAPGAPPTAILIDMFANASPNPDDPRRINVDVPGVFENELYAVNGQYTWNIEGAPLIGDATFKVLGANQWGDSFLLQDQDFTDASLAFTEIPTESRQWVFETHLASAGSGAFDWIVGFFYLGVEDEFSITSPGKIPLDRALIPPEALGLPPGPLIEIRLPGLVAEAPVFSIQRDNADSLAVFGQTTYTPRRWDSLRFTLGLRFSADWKRQLYLADEVTAITPFGLFPFQAEVDDRDKDRWTALTGKLGVDWFWGEDENLLYASASRGYKAGTVETAVAISGTSTTQVPNADPEFIWAFELGSKNRFFEDRLQANLAAFFYDYDDLQVTDVIISQVVTQNAGSARMFGVEAELTWLPIDPLRLILNAGYLNAEITDGILVVPESPALDEADVSGNRMPRAPRWTLTFAGDYTFDLGRFGSVVPRVQVYASGDLFFRAFNQASDKQDSYTRTDLRLTWSSASGRYSIEGWVENIEDDDVTSTKVVGTRLLGAPIQTLFNAPRTAGIRVGVRW